MTWASAFTLAKRVPSAVYVIALAVPLLGMGVHKYNGALIEKGRAEVRAAALNDSLAVARAVTQRAETTIVLVKDTVKVFTHRATIVHDTIRVRLASLPDTVRIPVVEVRRLVDSVIVVDSLALAVANRATAAAESLARAERAEKLLWKTKAETVAPTVIIVAHKWRERGTGFGVGGMLGFIAGFYAGRG